MKMRACLQARILEQKGVVMCNIIHCKLSLCCMAGHSLSSLLPSTSLGKQVAMVYIQSIMDDISTLIQYK